MSKPIRKNLWTNLDAIGLLNGLGIWDTQYKTLQYVRRPIDNNLDLRDRIIRSHNNPPGTTLQGLVNGLSNELGLEPYSLKTKKTFYLSYQPTPIGTPNEQDIFAYYNISGVWYELLPQVWSENYYDAKSNNYGFIVWQNDRYQNIEGLKNFEYSNIVEILQSDIPSNTEFKFIYSLKLLDEDNNITIHNYTDINNPNDSKDDRFTYYLPETPNKENQIIAYTLNSIPSNFRSNYYNDLGEAKDFIFTVRDHINTKYKHKWNDLRDSTCVWDIHLGYGSGHIPHFYDAVTPPIESEVDGYRYTSESFNGGIESYSESLYVSDIEISSDSNNREHWYPRVYPGKFYVNGIPYYLFENPQTINLTFNDGSCAIPTSLERYYHVILVNSGFYNDSYSNPDSIIDGKIYEDYNYPVGYNGNNIYGNIYRKKSYIPNITNLDDVSIGEYMIDYENSIIYAQSDSEVWNATLIYDAISIPSGTIIEYDLNPLNDQNISLESMFLFFGQKEPTVLTKDL